uniref:Uncharacterized protein n=1 Tax=Nelumbo nucifera TaxID=4432 RepID=A0A822Z6B1_NELNU|nr:TPA_asm: hypothetical protein HUJ06_016227 [Nelumbo nucifera]
MQDSRILLPEEVSNPKPRKKETLASGRSFIVSATRGESQRGSRGIASILQDNAERSQKNPKK